MEVCNCSMFCCTLLYIYFSIAIILRGKRELIALLNLSSWCLVMVERLFLAVPPGRLRFVILVFPDHTHLLFFIIRVIFTNRWNNWISPNDYLKGRKQRVVLTLDFYKSRYTSRLYSRPSSYPYTYK